MSQFDPLLPSGTKHVYLLYLVLVFKQLVSRVLVNDWTLITSPNLQFRLN